MTDDEGTERKKGRRWKENIATHLVLLHSSGRDPGESKSQVGSRAATIVVEVEVLLEARLSRGDRGNDREESLGRGEGERRSISSSTSISSRLNEDDWTWNEED